jgi:glycosyltransferase involved in cell wall biosynthesis
MKLFVLTHTYLGDGSSEMLIAILRYWRKSLGWEIDALTHLSMSKSELDILETLDIRLIERANFSEQYDFVLINCLQNIRYVDFIYPNIPIMLWAHEAETVLSTMKATDSDWLKWFSKLSLIIFQTSWQQNIYSKYLKEVKNEKIAIIPNGICPLLAPTKEKSCDNFKIVNVGKITPLKNQEILIHAVISLLPNYRIECELIGDSKYLNYLNVNTVNLLKKYSKNFSLPGHVLKESLISKLALADLFCFTSLSESFGLAPLEAASMGLTILLPDLPVYKEVGWVKNKNCLMFIPNDLADLQSQIKWAINNKIQVRRIGAEGKKLSLGFSISKFESKMTNVVSTIKH